MQTCQRVDSTMLVQQSDEASGTQSRTYPGLQLNGLKRFGDIIHTAAIQCFDNLRGVVLRREKDDQKIPGGLVVLQLPADLKTVFIRHADVEKNHVGFFFDGNADAFIRGKCIVEIIHGTFEVVSHQLVNIRVVVDE